MTYEKIKKHRQILLNRIQYITRKQEIINETSKKETSQKEVPFFVFKNIIF